MNKEQITKIMVYSSAVILLLYTVYAVQCAIVSYKTSSEGYQMVGLVSNIFIGVLFLVSMFLQLVTRKGPKLFKIISAGYYLILSVAMLLLSIYTTFDSNLTYIFFIIFGSVSCLLALNYTIVVAVFKEDN